jgi:hypothetical protein
MKTTTMSFSFSQTPLAVSEAVLPASEDEYQPGAVSEFEELLPDEDDDVASEPDYDSDIEGLCMVQQLCPVLQNVSTPSDSRTHTTEVGR